METSRGPFDGEGLQIGCILDRVHYGQLAHVLSYHCIRIFSLSVLEGKGRLNKTQEKEFTNKLCCMSSCLAVPHHMKIGVLTVKKSEVKESKMTQELSLVLSFRFLKPLVYLLFVQLEHLQQNPVWQHRQLLWSLSFEASDLGGLDGNTVLFRIHSNMLCSNGKFG